MQSKLKFTYVLNISDECLVNFVTQTLLNILDIIIIKIEKHMLKKIIYNRFSATF